MGISQNTDAFKFQRLLMETAGFWPRREASIFYLIYGLSAYGIVVLFAVSLLLSTMVVKDFKQLILGWSMFTAMLNCSLKFTVFRVKMPAFLELLDFIRSPHFFYHREEFDHHLKRIIKIATVVVKLFFCSGMTTYTCLISAPLFSKEERITPFPFPLDLKQYSVMVYILVYVFQSVALFAAAWISIGFDNLSTGMMGLCSAYFAILRQTIIFATEEFRNEKLDNINLYSKHDKQIYRDLSDCSTHHLAVISFTQQIEKIFSYVFLSQFLCSAGGICLSGFTFINSEPGSPECIFALNLMGTLMFQITLYCAYGNEVTVQSAMVLDACYMTEWIYCGPEVRRSLFLIMERSKRPLALTAGKFVNLSLSSLVSVIKSAGSYAMVLYQLYHS
ncbi:hypothetical protein PPYR_02237 [Photinus pyralis]|uniref:Odorant receptor n=1 Tax=Photinus pyralis TaxID=7054 RepID=A0A5N4B6N4_PHOPY|nr:odorant receptor 46a-like [Photinus pyralis]XP_031329183.1 odorant receptor 46a-like [Photinus pyralis]KAB0805267.1 hypothetical protein PPYR_02237 [Photinus pyralis]